jgi:hypothetical protein
MTNLPPAVPGTSLRILATSDLGAATVPFRTSYGDSGTCAGVVSLLPIGAAAAGNHDFDDGVAALLAAARTLSFPLLCANLDVGLPATAMVATPAGGLGVIGLTHPQVDRLSSAPPPSEGWHDRVPELAGDLRGAGARWVVALLHEGVTWWPTGDAHAPVATRSRHLEATARRWARNVDLILGGHNFASWTGRLGGTPAGEPHLFASSVLVVDVADAALVRGVHRVPAVAPGRSSRAIAALDEPAARVAGELPAQWLTRTGAEHYLPNLIADAFRAATDADAAFVMPSFHGIQAPLDGTIASLGPGAVTELDLLRLVADDDYDPVIGDISRGELDRAREAHWETADPRNSATDSLWWNWCRMPAGISGDAHDAGSVAVVPAVVDHLSQWLNRDLDAEPADVTARQALTAGVQ